MDPTNNLPQVPDGSDSNRVLIDGSVLEGGGQVIRTALSLAFLLDDKPLIVHSIRAGRVNRGGGGLKPQHLESVRLAAKLSRRKLTNDFKGSSELLCEVEDNNENAAEEAVNDISGLPSLIIADTGTAGALTLILQAALPPLVLAANGFPELHLIGGTDVEFSPPAAHFELVLLPLLDRMGIDVMFRVDKRGFCPHGGGEIVVRAKCRNSLEGVLPIQLIDRGIPVEVKGHIALSPGFDSTIANEFLSTLEAQIKHIFPKIDTDLHLISDDNTDISLQSDKSIGETIEMNKPGVGQEQNQNSISKSNIKSNKKKKKKQMGVVSVQIAVHTSTGCILSCNRLRTHSKVDNLWFQNVIDYLMNYLNNLLESGVCVDEHTADQLIVWMALAHGSSCILAPLTKDQTSQHLETVIHFARELTGAKFIVSESPSGMLIECSGISRSI